MKRKSFEPGHLRKFLVIVDETPVRRVGVLAGAICALSPHLVAHGKIVGHEAPTVLWWTLVVWLSLRLHDGLADRGRRDTTRILAVRMAVIGLVFGLAVSSSWGNGHASTYRALVGALSEAGHDVLRFDYFGTGDSGGDTEDFSLEGAAGDSAVAVDEMCEADQRRLTGASLLRRQLRRPVLQEVVPRLVDHRQRGPQR